MRSISNKFMQLLSVLWIGAALGLSACNDQPKQQTGEVAIDTTAGNDAMIIDTTSNVSYGIAGEVLPGKSPDLDTLKYIDKGEKPENVYEEK